MNGRGGLETELAVVPRLRARSRPTSARQPSARGRAQPRARRRRAQPAAARSTPRASTPSIAGRAPGATSELGTRRRSTCRANLRCTAARSIATARGTTRRPTATCGIPTVAPGWRPYYDGYWSSVPRVRLDLDRRRRLGWPTHHYGRWGFAGPAGSGFPGPHWGSGLGLVGVGAGLRRAGARSASTTGRSSLSASRSATLGGWTVVPRDSYSGIGIPFITTRFRPAVDSHIGRRSSSRRARRLQPPAAGAATSALPRPSPRRGPPTAPAQRTPRREPPAWTVCRAVASAVSAPTALRLRSRRQRRDRGGVRPAA